jgi:hypothetical protein
MATRRIVTIVLLALAIASAAGLAGAAEGQWVPLFNGKDLTGWKVKIKGHDVGDNFGNTFRVEDGVIKVRYDQYQEFGGKFGHLFYEKPFSNYRLCRSERPSIPKLRGVRDRGRPVHAGLTTPQRIRQTGHVC